MTAKIIVSNDYGERTPRGRNLNKRDTISSWTKGVSRSSSKNHARCDSEIPAVVNNREIPAVVNNREIPTMIYNNSADINPTGLSLPVNTFDKDASESKVSTELEKRSVISEALGGTNSSAGEGASVVHTSSNGHANTRSFGHRSRSNNSSKQTDSSKSFVHNSCSNSGIGFQKKVHNTGHRNVPFTAMPFDLTLPPPPIYPFPGQPLFYPGATFHNQPPPQMNCMQQPRPQRNFYVSQNNQLPERFPNFQPREFGSYQHQSGSYQHQSGNSVGVARGTSNIASNHGHQPNQSEHRMPMHRNYPEVKNSDTTPCATGSHVNTKSITGNVKNNKPDNSVLINNQKCDTRLQKQENVREKRTRKSIRIEHSLNDPNKVDALKNTSDKIPTATRMHSNNLLEKDQSKPTQQEEFLCGQVFTTSVMTEPRTAHPASSKGPSASKDKTAEHNRNSKTRKFANKNNTFTSNKHCKNRSKYTCNETTCQPSLPLNFPEQYSRTKRHFSSELNQNTQTSNISTPPHYQANTSSHLNTFPCLPDSAVHPTQAAKHKQPKLQHTAQGLREATQVELYSECSKGQLSSFASQNNGSKSHLCPQNDDSMEQVIRTEGTATTNDSASILKDIPRNCVMCSGYDTPQDSELNVHEYNVKQTQTEEIEKACHQTNSTSSNRDSTSSNRDSTSSNRDSTSSNRDSTSLRLAITDEIDREMAKALSMLIPVNTGSHRSTQSNNSFLNPSANEYCPKIVDCHGNGFVMVEQKGICYFRPEVNNLPAKTHLSESDGRLGTQYFTCQPLQSYVVSLENSDQHTHTPDNVCDPSSFSQTFVTMGSAQYEGQQYSSYADHNDQLIDTSVFAQNLYLTDAVTPSTIGTLEITEFSHRSDSNQMDPGVHYSPVCSPLYHVTLPYTDHPSMLHFGHGTDALRSVAWSLQTGQTKACFGSNGDAFYSQIPRFVAAQPLTSSPSVPFCGTEHNPVVVHTQLLPCMFPQATVSDHALVTQHHHFPQLAESTKQMKLSFVPGSTNEMRLAHAPEFNLYATHVCSSVLETTNTNPTCTSTAQSDSTFFASSIERDTQCRSLTKDNTNNSELCNVAHADSWSENDCRLIDSPVHQFTNTVVSGEDPTENPTLVTVISNSASTPSYRQDIISGKNVFNEYSECKKFLETLYDKKTNLHTFRRRVSTEPDHFRHRMEQWTELALRIIEQNRNIQTIDEMTASVILMSANVIDPSAQTM